VIALDHEDLERFAGFFVRYTDAGHFQHLGMGGEYVLDFIRVDVEAGDQNHVLLAVYDVDKPLLIDTSDIPGPQVTVFGESVSCFFRLLPVARHDLRPSDAEFPRLPNTQFVSL